MQIAHQAKVFSQNVQRQARKQKSSKQKTEQSNQISQERTLTFFLIWKKEKKMFFIVLNSLVEKVNVTLSYF